MLDMKVGVVKQSGSCAFEMFEKAGVLEGMWTA